VHGLEEKLVVVRLLVGRLLQRQQLVGAQIALVVACSGARQNRCVLVFELCGQVQPPLVTAGAYFAR